MFEDELSDMLDLYDEPERERITRLCYELLDNLLNLTQSESKDVKQAAFLAVALMSDSLKEKFAKVPPTPLRIPSLFHTPTHTPHQALPEGGFEPAHYTSSCPSTQRFL